MGFGTERTDTGQFSQIRGCWHNVCGSSSLRTPRISELGFCMMRVLFLFRIPAPGASVLVACGSSRVTCTVQHASQCAGWYCVDGISPTVLCPTPEGFSAPMSARTSWISQDYCTPIACNHPSHQSTYVRCLSHWFPAHFAGVTAKHEVKVYVFFHELM